MQKVTTRFAPSPTGYLHVGNIRTALVNWLYARSHDGKFILRIDDTDKERSKSEYVDAIKYDLEWLGLHWDEIHFQSQRMELYEQAKAKLIADKRLYPCYESQEELELKKKVLLSRNLPPIYDRSALKLSDEEKKQFAANGINAHWRFLMDNTPIEWQDDVCGKIHFDPKKINDPILIRGDGTMTYMIATIVDDIDLGITHIIRGKDHISNSAIHVQMFKALSATPPKLAHLSLIQSKEGEISKRLGGFDIKNLRDSGMHPMAILSFFAKLGTSDPIEFRKILKELCKDFSISKFGKADTNYDLLELERLNTKLIHHMNYAEAKQYLPTHVNEDFWEKVKTNLSKINEVEDWWKICNQVMNPVITDLNFTQIASQLLPRGVWGENTWNEWINQVKTSTNKNGKELFMPIRLALTGMEHGPELKNLLPLLGREKAFDRLNGKSA